MTQSTLFDDSGNKDDPGLSLWNKFPVYLVHMEAQTFVASCSRFSTSGRVTSAGPCWTRNSSESRNAAAACSLWQILEESVPEKYSLSPKACAGILRRAAKRGKKLPPILQAALESVASREL